MPNAWWRAAILGARLKAYSLRLWASVDHPRSQDYASLLLCYKSKNQAPGWEVHVRDEGLDRAIDAAGGVAQLARKIGISQPSVSNWSKVPAQRVIAVEAATGVSRGELRPDLFSK